MPIVHARVDERLIHGQVAMVWCRVTNSERIVVANDNVIKDNMLIDALKLSKPAGIKLSILSLDKAAAKLIDNAYGEEKIFLITKNIQDMKLLIEKGIPLNAFNVGNIAARAGSIPIKNSVSVTDKDIADLKELLSKGIKITAQMVPTESNQSIIEYLPKL